MPNGAPAGGRAATGGLRAAPGRAPYEKYKCCARLYCVQDIAYMDRALALAQQAAHLGEVPVGAVLVQNGQIIPALIGGFPKFTVES